MIYDTYDSVESIDAKLLAGNSGYDVVSHSGSRVARLIKAGILAPLDTSQLDNMKHMDASIMDPIEQGLGSAKQPLYALYVGHAWGDL